MNGSELWVEVVLDGVTRRRVAVAAEPLTVGREEGCDLVLADAAVSREHCRLVEVDGRLRLDDLGSVNGTFRGGQRIERATLEAGDEVEVGPFVLRVGAGAAEELVLEEARETLQGVPDAPVEDAGAELEVVLGMLSSFDLRAGGDEARASLLDALLRGLGAERAVLWRYRSKRGRVEEVLRHAPDPATRDLPVSATLAREVAKSREPCLVRGAPGAGPEDASVARLAASAVRSVMAVPMEQGRRLVGVLYLDSRTARRPFQRRDLERLARAAGALAGLVDGLAERDRLSRENQELRRAAGSGRRVLPLDQLATPGGAMAKVLADARRAAATEATLLITGETGTGKEELARWIHAHSARHEGPLVAVNCGAIPEGLLESELFGHAKGAFSGAEKDRAGLIERAAGGTLFLDEVGELPAPAQVKLLRVLAERSVTRLGEGEGRPVDLRLVAATLQDLPAKVEEGSFREDLYYRLHVVPLVLPPLRARGDDLLGIVEFLLADLVDRLGVPEPALAPDFLPALAARPWPGNIRQLRNALERALVLLDGEELRAADLAAAAPGREVERPPPASAPDPERPVRPYREELEDFERDYFRRLTQQVGDNVSAMSRVAGIARLTLYRRLGKLALDKE